MVDSLMARLVRIERKLDLVLALIGAPPAKPPVATGAVLTLSSQGDNMPGQITVDTENETVTLAWVDDKGDQDAAAPAGAVVAFTSDNEAVLIVSTDAGNPLQGDISPVSEGTANVGATITDGSGNPIFEPDGVTPFAVSPVLVTVTAGAAVGADLTLSV